MLIEPQRTFLTKIAEGTDFDVNLAAPEFIQQTADDLMAPLAIVRDYLLQVQGFRANPTYRPLARRRKVGPTRRPATRDDTREVAEDLRLEAEGRLIVGRQALRTKASEAAAQRTRDWHSLLERFRSQHADLAIEPRVLEYLQKRFCTSVRARQINARDVECELKLLLPISLDGETDIAYRSIIPNSVHQSAAAFSADPFALPRAPVIRKRPPKLRKAKIASAPEKAPFAHSGVANEFLTTEPRPLPVLAKGQRIPRNFFNDEQNELALDAVAVLKARSDVLNQRIAYAAMVQLFPGLGAPKLRQWFQRLVTKDEDKAYHERLKDAWAVVWLAKRDTDELPDPEPTSMLDVDLPAFVRCLRANVDKQAL